MEFKKAVKRRLRQDYSIIRAACLFGVYGRGGWYGFAPLRLVSIWR